MRCLAVLFIILSTVNPWASAQTGRRSKRTVAPQKQTATAGPNLQELQNERADEEKLVRISDRDQLDSFLVNGTLVHIPVGLHLVFPPNLEEARRVCTPWTASFISDLSDAFYRKFHKRLQINSAVRTVGDQLAIRKAGNLNAAPIDGPKASTHLTGATIDITKRPLMKNGSKGWMTPAQTVWMRKYLVSLMGDNKIIFVEERYQAVFHIWVSKKYSETEVPTGR